MRLSGPQSSESTLSSAIVVLGPLPSARIQARPWGDMANAIRVPSGDHDGAMSPPGVAVPPVGPVVIWVKPVPSTLIVAITNRRVNGSRVANAIFVPSGDQSGCRTPPDEGGK